MSATAITDCHFLKVRGFNNNNLELYVAKTVEHYFELSRVTLVTSNFNLYRDFLPHLNKLANGEQRRQKLFYDYTACYLLLYSSNRQKRFIRRLYYFPELLSLLNCGVCVGGGGGGKGWRW